MGDTGILWYVSGVSALVNDFALGHSTLGTRLAVALRPAPGQSMTLICPTACSSATTAYIGTACDSTVRDSIVTSNEAFRTSSVGPVAGSVAGQWRLPVDTSLLAEGISYRICTDMDGTDPRLAFGYAGVTSHITAVVSSTRAIMRAPEQDLVLRCNSASSCTSSAVGYLIAPARECSIYVLAFINDRGAEQTGSFTVTVARR